MALRAETQVSPRMTYNYRVTVEGLRSVLVSAVQIPERQIPEIMHSGGGANRNTKHPGKLSYTDLVIEKIMTHDGSDTWAYDWQNETRDDDGNGDVLISRRDVTVEHIADNGNVVLDTWVMRECWVKGISYSKNDSLQEGERLIETVTISVGTYTRGAN